MRFCSIVFLMLLFSFQQSYGSEPLTNAVTTQTTAIKNGGCDAPAPGNFHHTAIGSNSVNLGWNIEPQADGGYRIRAFRSSDGVLINTKYTANSAATSIIMDGLQMDESYDFKVNSVCSNGQNSSLEAQHGPIHTLIAELIVVGHSITSNNPSSCTRTSSGDCDFYHTLGTTTIFSISTSGEERLFEVTPLLNDAQNLDFKTGLAVGNNNLNFKIRCSTGSQLYEPDCSSGLYSINYVKNNSETQIATFKYRDEPSRGVITITFNTSGYTLKRLSPGPDSGRPGEASYSGIVKSFDNGKQNLTYLVSPNPFGETLDIALDQTPQSQVNVQLINPSGSTVLQQSFSEGNDQLSLSTADLHPGLYFLRVEINGTVQTAKIFKSE